MTMPIRITHRSISVLTVAILLVCAVVAFVYHYHANNGRLTNLSSPSQTKQRQPNMCGPHALYVAINRLGVSNNLMEIARELPITDRGVSFGDLSKCAQKRGFLTELSRFSCDDLVKIDTPVILWVNGNHFLTIDPREKHPEDANMVRIYDHGSPAIWWSRSKLESQWTGESMVIHNNQPTISEDGPKLKWKNCLQDCGFVNPEQKGEFEFVFENTGNKPLELTVAKIGCGCGKAEVKPNIIEPGKKGLVNVSVDMSSKRGYFSTFVLLNTNDPSVHKSIIRVSGGVLQPILTSLDVLYLGELHRGTSLTKSFYVQDRGDKTLQINVLNVVLDDETELDEYINCQVVNTPIQASNMPKHPISRYPVKIGDYRVDFQLKISPNAPIGPFAGKVLIETNQTGRFNSGSVIFKGTVISDFYAEPSAILLSRHEPSVEVRLKSRVRDPVKITGPTSVSGNIKLDIEQLDTPANRDAACRISVTKFDETGTTRGNLTFELNDKTSIVVPVVVYNGESTTVR